VTPKTVKFKSEITQIICQWTWAATLKAHPPMCTGQFVAWHHQYILSPRSYISR